MLCSASLVFKVVSTWRNDGDSNIYDAKRLTEN